MVVCCVTTWPNPCSCYRIPFYGYIRLFFLLYLILPQTQGARVLYEEKVHPFLSRHESNIDDFIASSHDRLKTAGITYLRQAIEYLKTNIFNMPPTEPEPSPAASAAPQSYTQSLLARFSVPTARWAGAGAVNTGNEFYSLLASAVSAATSAGGFGTSGRSMTDSGTLIPPHVQSPAEKMSFIAAQKERLNIVLGALDREAQEIQRSDGAGHARAIPGGFGSGSTHAMDEDEPTQRPPSGLSMFSALSKSKSETDFEKVEAESGAEDDVNLRRRHASGGGGSWVPWGWGTGADAGGGARQHD